MIEEHSMSPLSNNARWAHVGKHGFTNGTGFRLPDRMRVSTDSKPQKDSAERKLATVGLAGSVYLGVLHRK